MPKWFIDGQDAKGINGLWNGEGISPPQLTRGSGRAS